VAEQVDGVPLLQRSAAPADRGAHGPHDHCFPMCHQNLRL
jgi:hypothetical protein